MTSARSAVIAILLLVFCLSCQRQKPPLVVQVMRDSDAQFAKQLDRVTRDYALTKPRVKSGRDVLVGTMEVGGSQFTASVQRLLATHPEIIIVDPQAEFPIDASLRDQLGSSVPVCAGTPAYIPMWVSGEKKEAAEAYVRFLQRNCT